MEPLNREVLEAELSRDEGDELKAYQDSKGFWTIGTGRNLDRRNGDHTLGITAAETEQLKITRASCLQKGITNAQRLVLLKHDLDDTFRDLDRVLPWWRSLDPVRQRVLANMCFNMGIGNRDHGLLSFRNTLAAIHDGQYSKAADLMLASKWAGQVHARADRLAALMRLGVRKL